MKEKNRNIKVEDNLKSMQKFDDIDREMYKKAVMLIGLLITLSFVLLIILLSNIFSLHYFNEASAIYSTG
ncbi:hypothetical protein [Flavobacterium sp. CF136]|uniref:hypothetical protein n=1 Tax=Flavobacterium sp. (strain CF136) TaxID=1144313 RepID=UPI0002719684|nr:hypothetical protein [Flavobacterium sp. CF136]EJL64736.1 hypothetical protein PMI10_01713 [Flavobacterium sp. CF136]